MRALLARWLFPDLGQLYLRVQRLEAERVDLLAEWVKTRDQVIRYMKRAGALRARTEALPGVAEGESDDDPEVDDLEILRAKFR